MFSLFSPTILTRTYRIFLIQGQHKQPISKVLSTLWLYIMHIAHLRASREFDLNVVSEYNTWTTDLNKIQNNKKKGRYNTNIRRCNNTATLYRSR